MDLSDLRRRARLAWRELSGESRRMADRARVAAEREAEVALRGYPIHGTVRTAEARLLGDTIVQELQRSGILPPGYRVEVLDHSELDAAAGAPLRPEVAALITSWQAWRAEMPKLVMPGWSPCRFAVRKSPTDIDWVLGIARGSFGLWRCDVDVCDWRESDNDQQDERVLIYANHLYSGLGVGLFEDPALADEACLIADRLGGWELGPEAGSDEFHANFLRLRAAWELAGIAHCHEAHAHDKPSGAQVPFFVRVPTAEQPRPGKLS